MTDKEKMQALVDEIAEKYKAGTLELAVEGTNCRFITKDDKRCFIGQYMPMEWLREVRSYINRYTLSHALFHLGETHPEAMEKFPRRDNDYDLIFMYTIQQAHDAASRALSYEDFAEQVNNSMVTICRAYHLTWEVPKGGTS